MGWQRCKKVGFGLFCLLVPVFDSCSVVHHFFYCCPCPLFVTSRCEANVAGWERSACSWAVHPPHVPAPASQLLQRGMRRRTSVICLFARSPLGHCCGLPNPQELCCFLFEEGGHHAALLLM